MSLSQPFKNLFYSSVNVFSTKVLIEDTIFRLLLETGPPFYVVIRAREGPDACSAKGVSSFLSYFKTLSIVLAPGIETATSLLLHKTRLLALFGHSTDRNDRFLYPLAPLIYLKPDKNVALSGGASTYRLL